MRIQSRSYLVNYGFVFVLNFSVSTDFEEGWNVLVQTEKQKGLKLEEEEGQVSFVYTKKEPRPAFRYRINKESEHEGVRFITLVAPFEKEKPNVKIEVLGQPKIGNTNVQLRISEKGKIKQIGYSL